MQDREANIKTRYASLKADGEKIHSLAKQNLEYFKATEDSDDWRHYVEYLDDLILDGFFECIQCSLQYFLENMEAGDNKEGTKYPIMEAKFELQVSFFGGRGEEGGSDLLLLFFPSRPLN